MDEPDDESSRWDAVQGIRSLKRLGPLLARLRNAGCERDKAGNRELFFDQVCQLVLLTFFNPSMKTLRNLQEASRLAKVKEQLGCREAALGSLSEALHVFDAELLAGVIQELLQEIPESPDARLQALGYVPTAVDGTLLKSLPQITQACYATRRDQGWKLHTHFEILRRVPTRADLTDASGAGSAAEPAMLKSTLQRGRCYITDRGYESFALFNAIVAIDSSYVCRVKQDHYFTSDEQRPLSEEGRAAGVLKDERGHMGGPNTKRAEPINHRQRRIELQILEYPRGQGGRRQAVARQLVLVTSLLDVPVEVVVLLYRFRWLIELFFRWLKCVLSCRHLISQGENGIQIQIYCAVIACLLIQLATGRDLRPNTWTYKLICLYYQGWATEEELLAHLRQRQNAATTN
jgi:Transposase DDE domain